jgi:hypothetical protein
MQLSFIRLRTNSRLNYTKVLSSCPMKTQYDYIVKTNAFRDILGENYKKHINRFFAKCCISECRSW